MKVKFYHLEKIAVEEGFLRGTIELKGRPQGFVRLTKGKLYIRVKDDNLRKILSQPYPVTLPGKHKGGTFYHKQMSYHPGTLNHLKAIATDSWQFGYLAEVSA